MGHDHEVRLDTGSHLARQFAKVGRAASGDIVIGGLITPLTLAFDYDLSSLKEATSSMQMDMESCFDMRMIIKENDVYYLILKDEGPPYPVPNPEKTTV